VLAAYKVAKGDMDKVFGKVMLSNPLYDEARFRLIIEKGIEAGEVEIYKLFNQEPETKRIKRQRRAAKESTEAMEYAKELGVYDALFPPATAGESANKNGRLEPQSSKRGQKTPKDSGLAGLIQKKQQARASQFLEDLEAKYVGKKGTKRKFEEPPEDLFQKNRHAKRKVPEAEVEVEDESDEEVDDLGTEDSRSDADEEIKPTKSKGKSTKGQKGGKPRPTKVTAAKIPPVKKASVAKAPTRRGPTRKGVKEGTDS